MINRVILMGRLTGNPELKTTPNGVSVTSFSLAVDRSYVKNGEERKADFINIVAWRNTAEFVCRYFGKGSLIALEGQLQSRTYQAKDGSNRSVVEVVADNVSFTGERRDNNQQQTTGYTNAVPQSNKHSNVTQQTFYQNNQTNPYTGTPQYAKDPAYQSGDFEPMPYDDDLPF